MASESFLYTTNICCDTMNYREQKAVGSQSKTSQVKGNSTSATESPEDDDIEIIDEVMMKPANKAIVVDGTCFAVKTGDLWKKATVLGVYPSATGSLADEVGDKHIRFLIVKAATNTYLSSISVEGFNIL